MPKPKSTADQAGVALLRSTRIRLLGEPALETSGTTRPIKIDKAAAALAKLSLDGPQPREVLCTLLWPDAEPRDSAISLRQLSHRLSKLAGGVALLELGATVRLAPGLPQTDAAMPTALPPEALLKSGPLLAGCEFGKLQDLDRWLGDARTVVVSRCADALAAHAESLERERRLHEAIVYARRVVELVPHGEHGVRRLMRLHYLRHDRAAAKEAYQKLAAALREVQVEQPSAETEQLLQTVLLSEPDQATKRRALPPSLQHPPVLIGRDQALAAMHAAWSRQEPFLLVADAGLGKTRLLGDFCRGMSGCVIESAYPGDETAPLGLLGRVLAEIEARLAPTVAAASRAELARIRPEFGRAADLPADQARMRQAMAHCLQAAMAQGLEAVVLDDLHYADLDSIEALRWLSAHKHLRALRWGLATRPPVGNQPGQALTAWLCDSQRPSRIDLQPLTPAELDNLLSSLALPDLRGRSMARQLFRHAGGIPFFVLATLREALNQGVDLRSQAMPQPASVHALLDGKIGALPPSAQDVLRVAAVAGPELRADRVARMLGRSVLDLAEDWAVLEAGQMLVGERFSHDLMHDCALRSVPRGVRQALHRQFAALLMHDSSARAAAIARHWEEGEDWPQAAAHWRAAASLALHSGCLSVQITLLERAATCFQRAGDNGGRFDALHARLDSLRLRHGGDRVLDVLPELDALCDNSLRRLQCKLAAIAALVDLERAQEAAALADAAVADAAQHPTLLSDAHALQAQALAQRRRFAEATAAADRAWALADRAEDRLQTLRALHAQMYVRYADGWLADAVVWQSRALALSAELGRHSAVASGTGHLAALLAAIGDVRASHVQAHLAQRLHTDLGLATSSTLRIVNAIVLGTAAAAMGQYGDALTALQEPWPWPETRPRRRPMSNPGWPWPDCGSAWAAPRLRPACWMSCPSRWPAAWPCSSCCCGRGWPSRAVSRHCTTCAPSPPGTRPIPTCRWCTQRTSRPATPATRPPWLRGWRACARNVMPRASPAPGAACCGAHWRAGLSALARRPPTACRPWRCNCSRMSQVA